MVVHNIWYYHCTFGTFCGILFEYESFLLIIVLSFLCGVCVCVCVFDQIDEEHQTQIELEISLITTWRDTQVEQFIFCYIFSFSSYLSLIYYKLLLLLYIFFLLALTSRGLDY